MGPGPPPALSEPVALLRAAVHGPLCPGLWALLTRRCSLVCVLLGGVPTAPGSASSPVLPPAPLGLSPRAPAAPSVTQGRFQVTQRPACSTAASPGRFLPARPWHPAPMLASRRQQGPTPGDWRRAGVQPLRTHGVQRLTGLGGAFSHATQHTAPCVLIGQRLLPGSPSLSPAGVPLHSALGPARAGRDWEEAAGASCGWERPRAWLWPQALTWVILLWVTSRPHTCAVSAGAALPSAPALPGSFFPQVTWLAPGPLKTPSQ